VVDAEPAGAEILKKSSQKNSPQTLRVTQAEIFPGDVRSMQGICKSMLRPGKYLAQSRHGGSAGKRERLRKWVGRGPEKFSADPQLMSPRLAKMLGERRLHVKIPRL